MRSTSTMRLNALKRLLRVRHAATNEATRALADALARETEAEHAAAAAARVLAAETDVALHADAPDRTVEAYMAWLPTGRRMIKLASDRHDQATADVTLARTALGLAVTSEQAVKQALDRLEAAERQSFDRRATANLDEMAARRRPADEAFPSDGDGRMSAETDRSHPGRQGDPPGR